MSKSKVSSHPSTTTATDPNKPAPEVATKNEQLKCLVVVKNQMTYFGIDNPSKDNKAPPKLWRCTINPQRLFNKIDEIKADEKLDEAAKAKKVSEAFKSFTSPIPKAPFEWTVEAAAPAKVEEVKETSELTAVQENV